MSARGVLRCISLTMLLVCLAPSHQGEDTLGTCKKLYTVALKLTDNGTTVHLSQSHHSNAIMLPGLYLPTAECGHNYRRCDVFTIQKKSELLMLVPLHEGFAEVLFSFQTSYMNHTFAPGCHPIKMYQQTVSDILYIQCLNSSAKLHYLIEYNLAQRTVIRSHQFFLEDVDSLSPAVFVQSKIFLFEGGHFWYSDLTASQSLELRIAFSAPSCTSVQFINVYKDRINVYCNGQSWSVDPRSVQIFKFPQYHFPCAFSDIAIELANGTLTYNSTEVTVVKDFPHQAELTFGACVGLEKELSFWSEIKDGSFFADNITSEGQAIANISTCSANATCVWPFLDTSGSFGAYFNSHSTSVSIVNFTGPCEHRSIRLISEPDILHISAVHGLDECYCQSQPTTQPSTIWSTTTGPFPISQSNIGDIAGGVVGGVVLLVIIMLLIISIWVLYKRHRNQPHLVLQISSSISCLSCCERVRAPTDQQANGTHQVSDVEIGQELLIPNEEFNKETLAAKAHENSLNNARGAAVETYANNYGHPH